MDNTEKEIKDRFRDLDQQKKETARKEEDRIQKAKQEKISNSAVVRFLEFFQGKNNDYTEEEMALLETINDWDLEELEGLIALDKNGHLILRSEEDMAKLEGKQNAQILKDLLAGEVNESGLREDASARVLRVEDLDMTKARVYIAMDGNETSEECAYAYVLDQGFGNFRSLNIGGERIRGRNRQQMAFRAMSAVLNRYAYAVQPVKEVTVFIENEAGWVIEQNSYDSKTMSYDEDAENYTKTFLRCHNRGIRVILAPGLGRSSYANLARETAKAILK